MLTAHGTPCAVFFVTKFYYVFCRHIVIAPRVAIMKEEGLWRKAVFTW